MKYTFYKGLIVLSIGLFMASCTSSKKSTGSNGRVIVIDGKQVRVGEGARKDNGLHKGWYKNPNNPHHPNTTNPGHTKQAASKKGKKKK